ncbi:hypothetical protein BDY19DRAFT_1047882 [Irpex rosettiformis]|uniref:Uncharacterized protein n=1 Tax=Irpex rosettiformis TaxID=378272 RepID=A0ACB8U5E6_9APHY|nr:hypothetical protein BDY19DRAFT_1047882 [Irpex rosettiformis]
MSATAPRKSLKDLKTRQAPQTTRLKPVEDEQVSSPVGSNSSRKHQSPNKGRKLRSRTNKRSSEGGVRRKNTSRKVTNSTPEDTEDEQESDEDEDEDAYSEPESLHSDALDDDTPLPKASKRKRVRSSASPTKTKSKANKSSPRKKPKTNHNDDDNDTQEDEEYEGPELNDGQEIVGVVVQAPKTGLVPPGQVSKNTLNFLTRLKNPECNDREWFKLHEPVFRHAEKEWKDFLEAFTDVLVDADEQIPHLPPKDVMHRIYRDVRFSNDKTPYKTGFSASFSRSGRKGIFAGYHVLIKPGNESLIAAGTWCPSKNEINTIRNNLLRSSASTTRLRSIVSAREFVDLFGKAKPHPKGERQNIWGMGDELKVAPKGVDKNHKDIDLLKCRSFAVVHKFTDEEVLDPDFKEELGRIATVMRPFVHCINDLMTIQDAGSDDDDDDDEQDGEEVDD